VTFASSGAANLLYFVATNLSASLPYISKQNRQLFLIENIFFMLS